MYTKALVQEAEARGFRTLCITVDTPVAGVRNRQQRVDFTLPDGLLTPHMPDSFALTKSLT